MAGQAGSRGELVPSGASRMSADARRAKEVLDFFQKWLPIGQLAIPLANELLKMFGDLLRDPPMVPGADAPPGYDVWVKCQPNTGFPLICHQWTGSSSNNPTCFILQGGLQSCGVIGTPSSWPKVRLWEVVDTTGSAWAPTKKNLVCTWTKQPGGSWPGEWFPGPTVELPVTLPEWLAPMPLPGDTPAPAPPPLNMPKRKPLPEGRTARSPSRTRRTRFGTFTIRQIGLSTGEQVQVELQTLRGTRWRKLAPPGTQEQKFGQITTPLDRALERIVGTGLELGDSIAAVFDALPEKCKVDVRENRIDQMVEAIFDCDGEIDAGQVLLNLLLEQLQDRIIAAGNKQKNDFLKSLNLGPIAQAPVGGQTAFKILIGAR